LADSNPEGAIVPSPAQMPEKRKRGRPAKAALNTTTAFDERQTLRKDEIPPFHRTRDERVQWIISVMEQLRWERGVSDKLCAEVWGCEGSTVRHASAEAWRTLKRNVKNPDRVKIDLSVGLMTAFRRALAQNDLKNISKIGDVLARVTGVYDKISRIEVSGPNGAPIAVEQRNELVDKLEKLIKPVITVAQPKALEEANSEE
jgi:hypothetical protein